MNVLCITLNPAIDLTATVERFVLGKVNRTLSNELTPAGKALNAAHVLSELGAGSVATGFLGADNDGIFNELFYSHDKYQGRYGIGYMIDDFIRIKGLTRTNVKIVEVVNNDGRTTDINGQGFVVSDTDKHRFFEALPILMTDADAILVAGSLPRGFSITDFEKLLHILTNHHDKVAVDVSGHALKVALQYPLWLIKPNNDELSDAFGHLIATLDEQRQAITSLSHIRHVLVSMGDQGVHYFVDGKIYRALPPQMTVVSTVGAGDTMVGAMLYGLLSDKSHVDALTLATALSAYAVSIVGVGVPDSSTLDTLMMQTTIQQLT